MAQAKLLLDLGCLSAFAATGGAWNMRKKGEQPTNKNEALLVVVVQATTNFLQEDRSGHRLERGHGKCALTTNFKRYLYLENWAAMLRAMAVLARAAPAKPKAGAGKVKAKAGMLL
jgi:hypothetical protein